MLYRPVIEITPEQLKNIKNNAKKTGMTERGFLTQLVLTGYKEICNN